MTWDLPPECEQCGHEETHKTVVSIGHEILCLECGAGEAVDILNAPRRNANLKMRQDALDALKVYVIYHEEKEKGAQSAEVWRAALEVKP